jgi:hypothetical protein
MDWCQVGSPTWSGFKTTFMKISFRGLTVLLLFSVHVQAQKDIGFDATGRMVKFPPPVLRQNAKLRFTVTTDKDFIHDELAQVTELLTKTIDFLKTEDNDEAYVCLFGMKAKDYAAYLEKARTYLQDLKGCDRVDMGKIDPDDKGIIPLDSYFSNLYGKQFEVKIIGKNKKTLDSVFLVWKNKDCSKENCLTFQGELDKRIKKILENQCPNCKPDSLDYQLVYHDPLNNAIVGLFKDQLNTLKSFDEKAFMEGFKPLAEKFDSLNKQECDNFQTILDNFMHLKAWFKTWLWFTGGLTLNPFPILVSDRQKEIKDRIVLVTKALAWTSELLRYNDSAKTKLWPSEWHYRIFLDLMAKGDFLKNIYSKDSVRLIKLKKEQEAGYKIGKTSALLYGGKLMISRHWRLIIQKQFDVLNDYQVIFANPRQLKRMTEIPENERVVLMVQNVDSAANLFANEKALPFNDLEDFTQVSTTALANASITSDVRAPLAGLLNVLGGLGVFPSGEVSTGRSVGHLELANVEVYVEKVKINCKCSQTYPLMLAFYNALNAHTDVLPTANLLKPLSMSKPLYATDIIRTQQYKHVTEAPYLDSITIRQRITLTQPTKKDTIQDRATTYLKIGKLRIMQLAAGVMFINRPISSTQVDTSSSGLTANSSTATSTAFFGFKLYIFQKSYNRDGYLFRPRYPLARLSVFGGFDFLHPLNTLYFGGGYDVVPGLSVLVGGGLYLKTYDQVENNQIINTYKSYHSTGLVYGVTVNPVLFVQFLKTFF